MNTPIVEYSGDQLEIDFDRPEFSICPSCASQVIKLADGCGVCGWIENQSIANRKLSSIESSISIPCLVKKPKYAERYPLGQPEVKGVIRKDEGDRFVIEVDGKEISISKLFVYPDFEQCSLHKCKTAPRTGKKVSDTSDKCSSKILTPSTKCSSKRRRHKGEGSGHIYYRTVTRNGKDYQQAYYQWRENDKQKTKYIPKKLLDRVEEAESQKLPVSDILFLLVGTGKCSSKKSDTEFISTEDKVIDTSDKCSSKAIPTSKVRRDKGKGSGWIQCKPIKRSGKEYKQYWYNYEEWREGDRLTKKSKYIPKRVRSQVEKMNDEKVPVEEILKVLKNKSKK